MNFDGESKSVVAAKLKETRKPCWHARHYPQNKTSLLLSYYYYVTNLLCGSKGRCRSRKAGKNDGAGGLHGDVLLKFQEEEDVGANSYGLASSKNSLVVKGGLLAASTTSTTTSSQHSTGRLTSMRLVVVVAFRLGYASHAVSALPHSVFQERKSSAKVEPGGLRS